MGPQAPQQSFCGAAVGCEIGEGRIREAAVAESASVVGIGDAENDHDLLTFCSCSVAVADAIPALKPRADLIARGSYGASVLEDI